MRNYLGHNLISISEPTKQLSKLETFICDLDWVCGTASKDYAEVKAKQQLAAAKQARDVSTANQSMGSSKKTSNRSTRTADTRTVTTAASSTSRQNDHSKSSLLLDRQMHSRGSTQSSMTHDSHASFNSERY